MYARTVQCMAHYMGLSNISWVIDIEFNRQFQMSDQIQWRRISYFSFLCVTAAVITMKTNCSYIWTFCVTTASVDIHFPISILSPTFDQISGTKSLLSFPRLFGMFLLHWRSTRKKINVCYRSSVKKIWHYLKSGIWKVLKKNLTISEKWWQETGTSVL